MARPEEEMAFRDDRIRTLEKERDALAARLAEAGRLLPVELTADELRQRTEEVAAISRITVAWMKHELIASQAMHLIADVLDTAAKRAEDKP